MGREPPDTVRDGWDEPVEPGALGSCCGGRAVMRATVTERQEADSGTQPPAASEVSAQLSPNLGDRGAARPQGGCGSNCWRNACADLLIAFTRPPCAGS